jgi:glycerol kinase
MRRFAYLRSNLTGNSIIRQFDPNRTGGTAMDYILALDQGTTSSRGIVFDAQMQIAAIAQEEFPQHYPASGWVEHDPLDLWATTAATARAAIEKAGLRARHRRHRDHQPARNHACLGPQDRQAHSQRHRLAGPPHRRFLRNLRAEGHEPMITARTGLLADPYFSATKLKWILDLWRRSRARAPGRTGLRHRR